MTELFLALVNRSIAAGWLVLALLVLRPLLKKAPKWLSPALWCIVGLRLLLPFSVPSALSLVPSAETLRPEMLYEAAPALDSGVPALDRAAEPLLQGAFAPNPGDSANPLQIWTAVGAVVWAVGAAAMLLYAAVSTLRLRLRLRTAVQLRDNLWECAIPTPFVLGAVRPRIYLPFGLPEDTAALVVAHEQAHIRRGDTLAKPIGFLLLSVYWFHPLLWAAYRLFCRDAELACDERVVRTLDAARRADYSEALLRCAGAGRRSPVSPFAFGETGVRERIRAVLHVRKPAVWAVVCAFLACAAAAFCFLTNPYRDIPDGSPLYYKNAAESAPEVLQAILYPPTDGLDGAIVLGYAKGDALRAFLADASWTQAGIPRDTPSSPGSVEFVCSETLRVTVWDSPALARVKNEDGERWYRTGRGDYAAAAALFTSGTRTAVSGGGSVPLIAFDGETPPETLLSRVYWLTVSPDPDAAVPFEVWDGDRALYGLYTLRDAETLEEVDFFRPSGLYPQTYLLQNTVPGRAYLVTLFIGDAHLAFGILVPDDAS